MQSLHELTVSGVEKAKPRRAPEVGEHTVEVLKSIGYSGEAIHDLLQSGAALDGSARQAAS
jgi:crotonobetainyl-CoA:carnitine CoA-transferase CaiB-like acyl-CoA transferase